MGEKLRACDCGAEDVAVDVTGTFIGDDLHDGFVSRVWCGYCNRFGPVFEAETEAEAIAAAIAGWNKRPEEGALRAENKRLEARIEELEAALNHAINAVLVRALDAALEVKV